MSFLSDLQTRAASKCELCGQPEASQTHCVAPFSDELPAHNVLLCEVCDKQIAHPTDAQEDHWRCLNDAMWSTTPSIQVLAYQLLNLFSQFDWTADLVDMMYLEEDQLEWAKSGLPDEDDPVHKDVNGVILKAGDAVTLIKDLPVKGAGFTAKRGTPVRNIGLVPSNANHIEGRVNDQRIVILTQYVKKN